MSFYRGYVSQHGNGLGNVLTGIVRAAIPIASKTLKGVAKIAGKSILRKGLRSLENMDKGIHPLQTSFSFAQPTIKRHRRKRKTSHRTVNVRPKTSNRRHPRKNQKGAGKKRNRRKTRCKPRSNKSRKKSRKGGYKRKRSTISNLSIRNKRRRKGSSTQFDIFSNN